MLTTALVVAAVMAGITGAWSPCGFSMVETLAPSGFARRAWTSALACATFTAGALAGGAVTFGGLAWCGAAAGAAAPVVAAAIALAAAAGEMRGARIVPQIRRQVPEPWRRTLPVPLAAGLYGVLLGLGFTTFVLTFAVWALAGIAVALGDPALGLAIGIGFGAGRALPVVALAPVGGGRMAEAMAERPRLLRGLRAADGLALGGCAFALVGPPAQAQAQAQVWPGGTATVVARGATDPSADGLRLALHRPGRPGSILEPGTVLPVPGPHPAVGGGRTAWLAGPAVQVADGPVLPAPGADAVTVSRRWVAWRAGGALWSAALPAGPARLVVPGPAGRPALAGDRLLFETGGIRIESLDLRTGLRRTLRREPGVQLRAPSGLRGALAYVRASAREQTLRTGPLRPRPVARDRVLYRALPTARRDDGEERGHEDARGHRPDRSPRPPAGRADTLWTTALAADAAYVTRLRQQTGRPVGATVLAVPRTR